MDETSDIQTGQAFSLFFTWVSLAIILAAAWITYKNKYIKVCTYYFDIIKDYISYLIYIILFIFFRRS